MSRYQSLAQQVESDFKAVMIGLAGMRDRVAGVERQMGAAKEQMARTQEQMARTQEQMARTQEQMAQARDEMAHTQARLGDLEEQIGSTRSAFEQYGGHLLELIHLQGDHGERLDRLEERVDKLDPPAA